MIDLQILFSFIVAVVLLTLSPGPDNMYVSLQTLRYGFKRGLAVILGLMTGCLVHTSFLAIGFASLLKQFPQLFIGIKLLGALYLFYLAYVIYKGGVPLGIPETEVSEKSKASLFVQGFFMNVLNPKVSLFFISFFPSFLFLPKQPIWLQFYALGAVFIAISSVGFIVLALLASRFFKAQKSNHSFFKVIHWVQIILFIGIGIFILLP